VHAEQHRARLDLVGQATSDGAAHVLGAIPPQQCSARAREGKEERKGVGPLDISELGARVTGAELDVKIYGAELGASHSGVEPLGRSSTVPRSSAPETLAPSSAPLMLAPS